MRIGVVGVGRMGSVHSRNLARMLPRGSLLIHDSNQDAARKVAEEVGATVCPTATALVDDADAVVVVTPATARAGVLHAAIAKGIPVFCEKPLTATLDEARDVAETTRRAGARVQVGFQRRFDPEYRALRDTVASGAVGRVLMIRGTAFDHEPPGAGYQSTAGDIFTDCLIHDIDAARWIAGDEVVAVQADAQTNQGIGLGTLVLTFAGGAVAVLTASRLNPVGYDHRMEVLGTERVVTAGPGTTTFTGFVDRFAGAYVAEMRAFLAVAAGDEPSPCTPDDAVRAQEIAVAAATAADTGARTPVASRNGALTF